MPDAEKNVTEGFEYTLTRRALRQIKAEAWDEGYTYAMDDDPRALAANPYRAEEGEATVCIAHGRFIPCLKDGEHRYTSNPYWVKSVNDYQRSDDEALTWEPAWEHPIPPGRDAALVEQVAARAQETPAHLTPEVELRLERMVDAANEAEIRWLLGEWLTEIASVIPPAVTEGGAA